MKTFRAGAATSNITPPIGTSLNGGMHDRAATHIHDELHARALVLDDGDDRLALVVCDSCMLPGAVIEAGKHHAHELCGMPLDRILVSATHTHSAPTAAPVFQSEPSEEYLEFLALRIGDGIARAVNNLAPAKIGWGRAELADQVFNRRWKMKSGVIPPNPFGQADQVQMNPGVGSPNLVEPAGPTDPEISFIALKGADDQPLALFANYSLHYVGDVPGTYVSADYYGAFANRIRHRLAAEQRDPPFVGIMSNGTSGNINNINFREARPQQPPYGQLMMVADRAAEQVAAAYQSVQFHDHAALDSREARLTLGRRLPTADDVKRAQFILSQAKGEQLGTLEEIYAGETVAMKDLPPTIDLPVQALRIGELGIAAIPCEVFVETGLAIKAESPLKPTFVISLANDYAGYLPTPEHHALGGYETWRARSSFLAVDAEPKIRAQALALLGELAKL
jgi:hypothetical protein